MEVKLVLISLACFRLAELFALDIGPYHCFENLRIWLGKKAGKTGSKAWANLAEGVSCPWCIGVWFAILLSPLAFFDNIVITYALVIFGVAGAQSFLQSLTGGKRDV